MPLYNNLYSTKVNLGHVLDVLKDNINYNLNCVKVATVESFNPEDLTVCCKVANKRLRELKEDGSQILQDYPLIYAKVHYLGWGDVGATFPIAPGMEGILLFNDRELETWFLTGQNGNLAYTRCHDLSDAIFICGLHSLPNMIQVLLNCFHLFYKDSDIKLNAGKIEANTINTILNSSGSVTINTPDLTVSGNLNVGTGVSAVVPTGSITLTFSNGILTGIS